jgi:PAS domain S-box-containing protein
MSQELSRWLDERQEEIRARWHEAARETSLIPATSLERLESGGDAEEGSFQLAVLNSLASDESRDVDSLRALVEELDPLQIQTYLNALRQVLFALWITSADPDEAGADWHLLSGRIDHLGLAAAQAFTERFREVSAEGDHWRTLYRLTHELSASMDLGYVLEQGIHRILEALSAERGAVFLLNSESGDLDLRAAQNWQDADLKLGDLPLDWQRGRGSLRIFEDAEARDTVFRDWIQGEGEALLVAPLQASGQLYGMFSVATSAHPGFSAGQLDLVDATIGSLANSLGNAEVIQTLSDQARELGLLLRQHQEESSKRESILASIADGVVFNDQQGQIVLVNRAAEQILRLPAAELIGHDLKELFELFTAGARDEILEAMRTLLTDPQAELPPLAAETVLQMDDLIISAHLAPVITEKGQFLGIVTVLRDITREVEADRAKSEFVSTVSHELRTPMTAIKGYTDLLYGGMVGEINDNQKRFLGIVRNNADRLTALISDLLDISRIETGRVRFEPETVRLGDVVRNVIEALAPSAAAKGHSLTYRVEAGLPEVMGDAVRLNQVFTNLVANAINYTPDEGEISVDVYSVEGAVRADVTDTGIGIFTEDLRKIFDRFYRADHPLVQESRGTGLGLSIVKMFIEMHGGRVWAESDVGKGSTFTVILPLPTTPKEALPGPDAPGAVIRFDKRHVLVADDDPDIADLVKLQLVEAGYRVTVVGRGAKVFEVARRYCPDLIILDILLPDMDGRAVLEALKSAPATADIPVVMLTVVADDGTASDLGAAGYLTKPIDGEELLKMTRSALLRRGRVLVVEDDVDTIEMMRLALRRVGYNVDIAAEGYEALSLARRWRPQVIVLDLRLPGMDGYETLTHLKRSRDTQGIPIIVTTAHVSDSEVEEQRLIKMGVESLLLKPFTVNQLVSEIDRVTDKMRRARG